ncbi:beta-N-acetylhexosaminidase [Chryseosolibacter histidini]|nr:family 20 glycosylhydrolase [Chryseosolibacter histidini]
MTNRPGQPFYVIALLLMLLAFHSTMLNAQDVSLIPQPVSLQPGKGSFTLTASTVISVPAKQPEVQKAAAYFVNTLKPATGFTLKTAEASSAAGIQLTLYSKADPRIGQEGYTLTVDESKVTLGANTPAGLFYGVQTLVQMLPEQVEAKTASTQVKWQIPAVSIIDYPRFAWRGIMLDVSRHFFSKDYVKTYIDQLARYKFNRLHLHLTDDHGWRLEIKSLPKLTQVGAWRVPRTGTYGSHDAPRPGEKPTYGGFYTQDDIREIVQYAKDRYVEILPEIDVPGHSMAAIAAYPELCVTKDTTIKVNPGSKFSTWYGGGKFEMHIDNTLNPADEKVYDFLDKVFTEVAALFPFEYIHMGGDECYKGYWEKDAKVQAFMKKNNLKDGDALQNYLTKRVGQILTSKKKKLIGWDEILEGGDLAPGSAVMSWRGSKGGIEASHQKRPVVMSPAPHYYLDMMQGDASIEPPIYSSARLKDVYAFNILPAGIDSTFVLGGQGNLWTEQVASIPDVEYMTYPRAFAIAENMWSPRYKKNWNDFVTRVEDHFRRFDQAGVNYAPSFYDPIITIKKNKEGLLLIDLKSEVEGLDLYYSVDNSIPSRYHDKYQEPIVFPQGADMFRVIAYRDGKAIGRLISLKTEELEKRVRK